MKKQGRRQRRRPRRRGRGQRRRRGRGQRRRREGWQKRRRGGWQQINTRRRLLTPQIAGGSWQVASILEGANPKVKAP